MWHLLDRVLKDLPKPIVALLALVLVCGIGILDARTPPEISLAVFKLIPIFVAAWYVGPRTAFLLSCLAGGVWFAVDSLGQGAAAPVSSPLWNLGSKLLFFCAFAYLLARLKRSTERERAFARRDPLTGLANRLAFFEQAGRELEAARRRAEPVSVAYLDVDDFKAVNDRAGHGAGDEVLVRVAEALSAELRAADLIARLGGDEFVALLPGADASEARRALQRVTAALSRLQDASGVGITVSVGVASFSNPPFHADHLVRAADQLMYRAKAEGKGTLMFESYGAVFVASQNQ